MATPYSTETLARIQALRTKVIDGSATKEEMKEAVRLMRGDRMKAAAASDTSRRAKAKAVIPSADDMLKELGEL